MKDIHGTKIVCIALIASMFSLILIPGGFAAIGVEEGDWIKYDYTVTGAPSGTPLPTWIKLEFLSIEGTTVTIRMTMRYSDGTEQNQTMSGDVATGSGDLSGFVIPVNLKVGDPINIGYYGNVEIAGESTRTYAGGSRTVVYASFSQNGSPATYYWDKQTGVLVEVSVTSGGVGGTAKATETNMWQATSFWMQWWLWAIIAVGIVILVGVVYSLKRRKSPPPTAPSLPSEGTETS